MKVSIMPCFSWWTVCGILALVPPCSVQTAAGSPVAAFAPAGAVPKSALPLPPQAVESRPVIARIDSLAGLAAGDKIALDPFTGLVLTGTVELLSTRSRQRFVLKGTLDEDPLGSFVIAVEVDAVAGLIDAPGLGLRARIDHLVDGLHAISRVDPRKYGRCSNEDSEPTSSVPQEEPLSQEAAEAAEALALTKASGQDDKAACAAGQPVFDVLIAYTTMVRQAAGGTNATLAQIQQAITLANDGFANSQINARYRLVHAVEVSYNEVGTFVQHLDRITNPSDGVLDNLHTLRNDYKADYVQLWVTDNDPDANGRPTICGRANCDIAASEAFSLVDWTCVSNFSVHHEMGHNQGCAHNRADAGSGCNEDSYSYGWRWFDSSSKGWRTIMAYDNSANDYTRINYFSNPNVTFGGNATGVAVGNANEAYNAKTISDRRSTFEGHRISGMDVWVQFGYSGTERGTFSQPFNTIAEGHSAIIVSPTASETPVLHVKAGTTTEKPTLNKPLILEACGGTVRIGG